MRCACLFLFCVVLIPVSAAPAVACENCIDYGTDPVEPIAGTLDITDDPFDVEVRGDLVYLVTNNSYFPEEPPVHEIVIVDVSDPALPVRLGFLDSPWGQSSLDVGGGFAYVAGPALAKIDVSDPTSPVEVGFFDFEELPLETAKGLEVEGDYAYVISDIDGQNEELIRIFDVSGEDPLPAGSVEFPYHLNQLAARDSYVYAVGMFGLWVVDVSDPGSPSVVANVSLGNQGTDIGLVGDIAVVGVLERPSVIFDISDPASPVLVTEGPSVAGFEISGDLLYYGLGSGLRVADLSDPANPTVIGTATDIYAFFFDVDGCHVATVNPFHGDELRMVPVHCTSPSSASGEPAGGSRAGLVTSAPNPFHDAVTLRLSLPGAGPVRVSVHDVSGRIVRGLTAGSTSGSLTWDGRDGAGRRVRGGRYLFRIAWDGGSTAWHAILLE